MRHFKHKFCSTGSGPNVGWMGRGASGAFGTLTFQHRAEFGAFLSLILDGMHFKFSISLKLSLCTVHMEENSYIHMLHTMYYKCCCVYRIANT